jgi:ATP-dependent Clp protease ATP-binding subunit ClpC
MSQPELFNEILMDEIAAAHSEISFYDPRLRMTIAGRLLVRVVTWITYLVVIAATFTFLISGVVRLRAAGILLGLILIDLLIHRGEGDLPIAELPKSGANNIGGNTQINVARVMRPSAFATLEHAFDTSAIMRQNFFLEATKRLLEAPEVEEVLRRLDIPLKEFKEKLDEFAGTPASASLAPSSREEYLKQAELLAVNAFGQAAAGGHNFIEIGDLFAALPEVGDEKVSRLFNLFSVGSGDIERALIFASASERARGRLPAMVSGFMPETHRRIRHRIMNRAWTSRPTPTLDQYGTDFTDLARDGSVGFLVGHAEEYKRLVETLARPTNPNALLVGEAGIGKEAIVQHLAARLAKDDVPKALFDKRLVSLELQNLVAGAAPEILNARLKTIVEEIYLAGNIILYIPDIHNLVKTSGTAYLSAADALMPVIMNNAFPIVGATYPNEFKQLIEPRSDFAGAFEVIRVSEITETEAEKILTYESAILEKQAGVTISFGAVKRAVALAKKYMRGKFLPSSAGELLKGAVVEAERGGEKAIGPDLIIKAAEAKTKIPIHEAKGDEAEKLLNMEEIIHARLIDQEEAVKAVATALREYRSGLTRKGGPIASFLFVGPTGVGKTELAKILADVQFGGANGAMMTRFDMTEYQDKASYIRFIGSPDGQTHGALTDAVLEKPYSLILLDEFEKAFPDILNLFLQVLDDGRLTDGLGRTVDFTNTIVIATSNAHSDIINDALAKGESMSDIAEYLKQRLVDVFKPELINRFSKIIIFKNLEPAQLKQIVTLNLAEFAATLKDQGIYLDFDPDAVAQIAKLGYDPAFGARPLRRVIEEKIRAPLAEEILAKKIVRGARVKLIYKDGIFSFTGTN